MNKQSIETACSRLAASLVLLMLAIASALPAEAAVSDSADNIADVRPDHVLVISIDGFQADMLTNIWGAVAQPDRTGCQGHYR